jgi:hypothetical protein
MAADKTLTPAQRQQRARIAALARWAKENPVANGARAQAGLLAKYEREAREAEPGLTDAEYARRAECLRQAHMERMSFASSRARTARAQQRRADAS